MGGRGQQSWVPGERNRGGAAGGGGGASEQREGLQGGAGPARREAAPPLGAGRSKVKSRGVLNSACSRAAQGLGLELQGAERPGYRTLCAHPKLDCLPKTHTPPPL